MYEVIETHYSQSGQERVLIVRRSNGSFGFEAEYFSANPLEMCWCPFRQHPFCICDSAETALRVAQYRVDWMKNEASSS